MRNTGKRRAKRKGDGELNLRRGKKAIEAGEFEAEKKNQNPKTEEEG